ECISVKYRSLFGKRGSAQNAASGEVSANINEPHIIPKRFFIPFPKANMAAFIHYPLFIFVVNINGAVKGFSPVVHVTVIVRMRKSDGIQSAFRFDEFDSALSKQGETVPQNISLITQNE